METLQEKTVADYVAQNIKTAHVFKKHGIDFCCGGKISLATASKKYGVDYTTLLNDLHQVENTETHTYNYNQWALDFLADHIVHVHHAYIEENIPIILAYAQKVNRVHGAQRPELEIIEKLLQQVCGELAAHLKKEEIILFPFIKKMITAQQENLPWTPPSFKSVENPVQMMEEEHDSAGEIFKEIAALSNQYTPPENACNTYRAFYQKLQEFEDDLHLHVHLENNILFPKAKQLEKDLVTY